MQGRHAFSSINRMCVLLGQATGLHTSQERPLCTGMLSCIHLKLCSLWRQHVLTQLVDDIDEGGARSVPAVAEVLAEAAELVPVVYQRAVVARQHQPDALVAHLPGSSCFRAPFNACFTAGRRTCPDESTNQSPTRGLHCLRAKLRTAVLVCRAAEWSVPR